MSDLMKQIMLKTANMPPPAFKVPKAATGLDWEPIPWNSYFDSRKTTEDGFLVYRAGPKKSTSEAASSSEGESGLPYIFLLHGAGYSSLSWSLVASELKEFAHVIAYDFRGHGGTRTPTDDEDFSSKTLSTDSAKVITDIIEEDMRNKAEKIDEMKPKLVIVGHSMGGAIAARTALLVEKSWLKGLVLIDIVEGSALAALPSMNRIIAARPIGFESFENAIIWARHSKMVQNSLSARISVPSQLVQSNDPGSPNVYTWRVNLASTEPYWKDWYEGLSKLFLSVPAPKVLLLAGTDRLDQELTVGQMMGKFQMCLLPQAGHVIQEDAPQDTAATLITFMKRQKLFGGVDPPISIPSKFHR